jgi:hypothetical protein
MQQADLPAGLATLLGSVTDANHGLDGPKNHNPGEKDDVE